MNLKTDLAGLTIDEEFSRIIENIKGLSDIEMKRERISEEYLDLYLKLVLGDIKYFIKKFSWQINYDPLKESLRKKAEEFMTKVSERYESQNTGREK